MQSLQHAANSIVYVMTNLGGMSEGLAVRERTGRMP